MDRTPACPTTPWTEQRLSDLSLSSLHSIGAGADRSTPTTHSGADSSSKAASRASTTPETPPTSTALQRSESASLASTPHCSHRRLRSGLVHGKAAHEPGASRASLYRLRCPRILRHALGHGIRSSRLPLHRPSKSPIKQSINKCRPVESLILSHVQNGHRMPFSFCGKGGRIAAYVVISYV